MRFYRGDVVTTTPDGGARISFDIEEGVVGTFTFTEIEQTKTQTIDAILRVVIHIEGKEHALTGHLNLLSLSSRETFLRQLGYTLPKKLPLPVFLGRAIEAVQDHLGTNDGSVWFEDIQAIARPDPLFPPFLVDGAPNLIFGKGGTGKTFICLRMALSMAFGIPFLGVTPTRKCKVLFVDYEDSQHEFADRINKLLSGLGQYAPDVEEIGKKIKYFRALNPFQDIVPALKKIIQEEGISFVIVDSAIMACGSEPEKADVAARYFNALAKLQTTSLTIAHETKAETHNYPFGSVVWWNSPRNIWNIQGMGGEQSDDEEEPTNEPVELGLFHRKANNGARSRLLAATMSITDNKATITQGDRNDWESEMTVATRITKFLRDAGQPKSRKDIEKELDGVEKNTIKQTLRRLHKSGKITLIGGQGGEYVFTQKS